MCVPGGRCFPCLLHSYISIFALLHAPPMTFFIQGASSNSLNYVNVVYVHDYKKMDNFITLQVTPIIFILYSMYSILRENKTQI